MTGKGTFLGLYRKLNPEQRQAVDAIEGPVMVIAGPGTGKTQILTLRIANILRKTDTSPDSILALTFTESGAFSMRKRLVEIIGSAGYRVRIHTFHGFANDVIRRFPDEFPRIIGSAHIKDVDKINLLKEIILESDLLRLKPFGDNFYYLRDIRAKIAELKRENITPETLTATVEREEKAFRGIDDIYYQSGKWKGVMRGKYRELEKKLEKDRDLSVLYARYQDELRERKHYDYEDMIMETVARLLEDQNLLLSLQEEYHYILADEHQDANNAQNRLLELLASFHESPNLFIVGDEKQAIFRFQGASLENFRYFQKRFPDALLITLRENYRSHQHILDSAHSLISTGSGETEVLHSQKKGHEAHYIEVRAFSRSEYEYAFLAENIQGRIDEGVPPEEIAVLYRTNRDADALVRALEKTTVPFVVESEQNVLSDVDVRKLILLLRAVADFGNDGALLPALHVDFLHIEPLDLYRLIRHAAKRRMPAFAVFSSKEELQQAGVTNTKVLERWYKTFRSWKKAAENKPLPEVFEIIMNESGFIEHILSHAEADVKLEKVRGLWSDLLTLSEHHRVRVATVADYTLADYLAYLDLSLEHGVAIGKGAARGIPHGRVRLMTAHRSKGLEFDFVYIVGATDGHWGNRRTVKHFTVPFRPEDNEDDERRLFYVALTRAREGVFMSYPKESERGGALLPSQFIGEIDLSLIEHCDTSGFEAGVLFETLIAPKRETARRLGDVVFLRDLFLEQGLSVTALNNYLSCPWRYFYSNLIRIPKAPTKHMLFGTAVHGALRDLFDVREKGREVNAELLVGFFETHLNAQPLSDEGYREMHEKGAKVLPGWFRKRRDTWAKRVRFEWKVDGVLSLSSEEVPALLLRGVFDRADFAENGTGVVVTDYKTGKPKSKNVIEGKTKSSSGDYKRQLVFYKLLLDLYDPAAPSGGRGGVGGGRYRMEEGVIDFIEPDDRGGYHEERFVIVPEEVEGLKEEIVRVAHEIATLSFWSERCDDTKCDYCALRDLMK